MEVPVQSYQQTGAHGSGGSLHPSFMGRFCGYHGTPPKRRPSALQPINTNLQPSSQHPFTLGSPGQVQPASYRWECVVSAWCDWSIGSVLRTLGHLAVERVTWSFP